MLKSVMLAFDIHMSSSPSYSAFNIASCCCTWESKGIWLKYMGVCYTCGKCRWGSWPPGEEISGWVIHLSPLLTTPLNKQISIKGNEPNDWCCVRYKVFNSNCVKTKILQLLSFPTLSYNINSEFLRTPSFISLMFQ